MSKKANKNKDIVSEVVDNEVITHIPIIKYPDHHLSRVSEECELPDKRFEARYIIDDMISALSEVTWGVPAGLAAPQVGHNKRIFLTRDGVYINPKILHLFKGQERIEEEGCYSLPDNTFYKKSRAYGLILEWFDLKGNRYEKRFNGHDAAVIQHEMDHLDGKMCNQ